MPSHTKPDPEHGFFSFIQLACSKMLMKSIITQLASGNEEVQLFAIWTLMLIVSTNIHINSSFVSKLLHLCRTLQVIQATAVMHFLALFSVVVLAISNHAEGSCLDCHLLKMVPAKWSRNGHDVRTLPLKCYVTEEKCSVDFLADILTYNHTVSHHRCNPTDYCDIDVYFKCPSNKYSLGKFLCVLFHPSTISFFFIYWYRMRSLFESSSSKFVAQDNHKYMYYRPLPLITIISIVSIVKSRFSLVTLAPKPNPSNPTCNEKKKTISCFASRLITKLSCGLVLFLILCLIHRLKMK